MSAFATMKTEFLPPKYDYKLLTNISNRRQKPTETFAEYLTSMQSLFKHLSIPINEQHKVCIIEENMLSKYAVATSVLDIGSLDQLSKVCRRVDYAYSKTPIPLPMDKINNDHRYYPRAGMNQGRPRAINIVEMAQQSDNRSCTFPGLELGAEEDVVERQLAQGVFTNRTTVRF